MFDAMPRYPVAIIGGGYSGTILAAMLARRGISAALVDGSGKMGRGQAYSTRDDAHLLNVRAERMSAFAAEPNHFADRYKASGGDQRGFARRAFYGDYLQGILDDAIASGSTIPVEADAISARRETGGWRIALSDGRSIHARLVVLAIGNQQPETFGPLAHAGKRLIANPWGQDARDGVIEAARKDSSVLLIGTGLTMVDAVLSLDAAGHSGRIVAVSRRGQTPLAHADFEPSPVAVDQLPLGTLTGMWRWLRRRSAEVGWQAAIDSLRPHSQRIWQSLDRTQQRRFLRHARPWWDVRRHRIAPEVAAILSRRIQDGGLEIVAGWIEGAGASDEGLDVEIKLRGTGVSRFEHFDVAINCTGPLHALARTRNPLLRDLLDQGLIRPDTLGIGIELGNDARVADSNDLWAIGPLTKGRYWEITAVPDIREQAAGIVDAIVERLMNDEQGAGQRMRAR